MKSLQGLLLLPLCLASSVAFANDAYSWLQRMNHAARALNYSGVFVYQSQGYSETSRIFHAVDASGEHERLETLDGPPREVVRNNEDVQAYLLQDHIIVNDKAILGQQPGRLISKPKALAEIYNIRLGSVSRVAGRKAQQIVLEPRDDMRYEHQLWVDTKTGLLIKARMLTGQAHSLEQFRFTELQVGLVNHEKLRPSVTHTSDWRVINAQGQVLQADDIEWEFHRLPPGFQNISLVRRMVRKSDPSAIHAVFSDGLANVSVFIEAQAGMPQEPPLTSAGSTGVYRRMLGDRVVTVMGEVPEITLRQIADGVERRPLN